MRFVVSTQKKTPYSKKTFRTKKEAEILYDSIDFHGASLKVDVHNSYKSKLFKKELDVKMAAMSAAVFVAHAGPNSKTEAFCKEILSLQKPLYTFENNSNNNIIEMGATPVTIDSVSV